VRSVLFVLLLGYFASWIKAFDAEPVIGINELALEIALPASLFADIVRFHECS
jgi:predicted permease